MNKKTSYLKQELETNDYLGKDLGEIMGELGVDDKEEVKLWTDNLETFESVATRLQEIMQGYEAALREIKVRFEILDQDLSLKVNRNPIHHIESRIKGYKSIYDKLIRYDKEPTLENMQRYVMDVAGVRIICSYIQDVYDLFSLLQHQDDLEIVRVKDYIADPKLNGYRSLHAIVRIPVYFMDHKQMVPVEIQLRTIAMDFWASLEHDIRYKAIKEVGGLDAYKELKDCSRIIEEVETRMQVLAEAADS
ncbi:MAG: GTP pyrophosphokinase [Eggerthellaceae bacterium]|jgi:putative GTP pyrophosphokinase